MVFETRLRKFKEWLMTQSERRIAVVCHWGVIHALTGKSLKNCEALEVDLFDIVDRPIVVVS